MKGDSEYGNAVSRLRVRKCTLEDLELFNTRVIKSANYINGVNMTTGDNHQVVAIVATNAVREVLNTKRAEASSLAQSLVLANALDKCSHKSLMLSDHLQLIQLDFSSAKASCSLPGCIPLYVGMPVILRV